MKIGIETLLEVKEDIIPLLSEHWEEVAVHKEKIKVNPCWETYKTLEDSGKLGIFTAREEGLLVGYFVVIASVNPHYKDHVFGVNDVIYLKPEYRGTRVGSDLITYAEDYMSSNGVSVFVINTKTHVPFDGVLKRLGFDHIENVYSKSLGDT
jgi:GNAT superfamily N-acetyltransferase